MRTHVLTVTAADCRRDTFRCGGPGGQNQNKRDTGVRFTHLASGAVGECREERSQLANQKRAWVRMTQHKRFLLWLSTYDESLFRIEYL
jgi:protein subunit release factor B